MSVKQISKIRIKRGLEENLPLSLSEGEFGYTTDTGSVYIGAPNLEKITYRGGSGNTNDAIFPYQNVKLLTEFDLVRTVTGDYYIQGPLVNTTLPITNTATTIYTFDANINSVSASFSLYDGVNVNMVGEMFISIYDDIPNVCVTGQLSKLITFSGILNSSKQIELQVINTTSSSYTLYLNAKCWTSDTATWEGTKGSGVSPLCSTNIKPYLYELPDVDISNPTSNQILSYNSTTSKWTNTSDTFISSVVDSSTDYSITQMGVEKDNNYLWVVGSMQDKTYFVDSGTFNNLSSKLDNEIIVVNNLSNSLETTNTNLSNEISRAENTENNLNTSIQIVTNNLNNEIFRAKAAEEEIASSFNSLVLDLTNEITRAKAAETNISNNLVITNTNLSNEMTRAKAAESTLNTNINTVASNLLTETNRAIVAENTKEPLLGFAPVQQGTGLYQNGSTVKIGSDGNGGLLATVDSTNLGNFAFQSWVENYINSQTTIITSGVAGDPGSYTIFKKINPNTASGFQYKICGLSPAFNGEYQLTIKFPITLNGIFPGCWGVSTSTPNFNSNCDIGMQVAGTPTTSSINLVAQDFMSWVPAYPVYGLWWIEGW